LLDDAAWRHGASPSATVVTKEVSPKPNIVIVMTDDESAFDGRLLDALPTIRSVFREEGVTLANFRVTTPLCCPARASFLTGLHTHHHGVVQNVPQPFKPSMTLATQLSQVGYHTILVGKYLNHYERIASRGDPPGWDDFSAFGDAAYYDYDLWSDGVPEHFGTAPEDHSTDVIARRAASLLAAAPPDRPLFAYIAPFTPHAGPSRAAPRYRKVPCPVPAWAPPNYNEVDVSDKPAYVRTTPPLRKSAEDLRSICRGLLSVDDLVASLRQALADAGRLDNTLLIFTSDNGVMSGEHRLGKKAAPYVTEIPFYVSWPAVLGTTPRVIPERLYNIDLAPTLCELAGCVLGPYPTGQPGPDGMSFAPLLLGTGEGPTREYALEEMPMGFKKVPLWHAIRSDTWHYVEYGTGERELYDVSGGPCWAWQIGSPGDPCELDNRAGDPAYEAIVQDLHARLEEVRGGASLRAKVLHSRESPNLGSCVPRTCDERSRDAADLGP
jgi:arylsulfatase A-like enzyme